MKLINTNKKYSIIDVNTDDLAAQFTLIDLPIFKSIRSDELTSLGSSSLRKQDLSPNIVAMNRQFNQITFWVVGQILSHDSPRLRAELISNFIKTAKRLHQLNNLHSSYAVVSALLSSPIYRLERTWHNLRKKYPKERQQFDQLKELFSDNNNYELLRDHLANCDLPCIPYLGMYFRDIIYTNEAHPEGTIQRTKNTSKILESIEKFQLSEYDHLVLMPTITCCLLGSRYIDELQKFVEDENYRRSLELEPPETNSADQTPTLDNGSRSHKRSAMLLASFASMVQSMAVLTTSHKHGTSTPPRAPVTQTAQRYLIDDSFIDHSANDQKMSFPPPISTSN